jgi:hypothetical protein
VYSTGRGGESETTKGVSGRDDFSAGLFLKAGSGLKVALFFCKDIKAKRISREQFVWI